MYERQLKIAIQAVKNSERTFRKYFGTKTHVQKKAGNYRNLVSYADKKIEEEIRRLLHKYFPSNGFIGEENGTTKADAENVWAVDPIDGTTNYLQGLSDCAISIALLNKTKPVVGVVYAPFLDRLYTANHRHGAKLNGKKIKIAKTHEMKKAFGSIGWGRDTAFALKMFSKLLPKIRKMRVPGSSALGVCYVAQGSYDFWLAHDMKIWDYAAAQVILEEAGGVFVQQKKPPLQIAGNKVLVKKLTALLSS